HGPNGRRSRAVPPDEHPAGRGGVPKPVGGFTEPSPRLAVGHPPSAEEGMEAVGEVLREPPALGIVRQPPEREDREIARRDDVRAEPRSPELNERRVLPRGRFGPLDARMAREERG